MKQRGIRGEEGNKIERERKRERETTTCGGVMCTLNQRQNSKRKN